MNQLWVPIGAFSALLAVALGAFGAHSLAARLDPHALAIYQTAAQYQMYHALALIGFGLWSARHTSNAAMMAGQLPGWAFVAGTILFSGSLYLLAVSGVKWLGAVTPFGGLSFMLGWVAFAFLAARH